MKKAIVVLGLFVLIAGIALALDGTTISVPDPNCYSAPNGVGYACNGYNNPDGTLQILQRIPFVNETVYPYSIVGGVVVLIGLVTMAIGAAMSESH